MKNKLDTFRHWIIDLDGTLADTAEDIVESLADACELVLGSRPEMDSSWNPMDIQAARMHNIFAVAAGWGYGSRESMEAQNPDFYCNTVQELAEWVRTK